MSVAPVQGKVTVTPETAATPFVLAKGNYRVNWKTTDCTQVTVAIVGDTGFTKEKSSAIPNFSWIVTSVPDGTYTITQTDPCARRGRSRSRRSRSSSPGRHRSGSHRPAPARTRASARRVRLRA